MIDVSNLHQSLSIQDRKEILNRALHSENFFTMLTYNLPIGGATTYSAKSHVDKDFYLTQIISNIAKNSDLANLGVKIYVGNSGVNIFSYLSDDAPLNIGFQSYVPRTSDGLDPSGVNAFDDRQKEIMPYFIKRNDSLLGEVTGDANGVHLNLIFGGYYPVGSAYLNKNATQGVNESLSLDPKTEWWNFTLEHVSTNQFVKVPATASLVNDRFARLVLGFAIVTDGAASSIPAFGTVRITDVLRNIKLTGENPIDLAMIAPRLGAHNAGLDTQDTNIYYLPIEHFWQPQSPLKFDFTWTPNDSTKLKFYMLTRTV